MKKIVVTSAIGTREYYRKFGYEMEGAYVGKEISRESSQSFLRSKKCGYLVRFAEYYRGAKFSLFTRRPGAIGKRKYNKEFRKAAGSL